MKDKVITSVRISEAITIKFSITIDLHQGSALGLYLFALEMDELAKLIQEETPWSMFLKMF